MKKLLTLVSALLLFPGAHAQRDRLDLSGEWRFRIDRNDVGEQERWYAQTLEGTVRLPGSMTTNGIGDAPTFDFPWVGTIATDRKWFNVNDDPKWNSRNDPRIVFWLTPEVCYNGAAWYQKEIEVPQEWDREGEVVLSLERCHWETTLWVDGEKQGSENSLSVPHRYRLGRLGPGRHTLTLRIDNRVKEINPGIDAHSISDHTQGNWNGVIGKLSLVKTPPVHIESVKLTPDVAAKRVIAELTVDNAAGAANATISLQARPAAGNCGATPPPVSRRQKLTKGTNVIRIEYALGNDIRLWDEFHPNLYTLETGISASSGEDSAVLTFGMREIGVKGSQVTVNGRPVFLRGTLECCIFPETGFPPTDEPEWERIMSTCREYGLNHLRFHSWCPPKAAFDVADRMGFYLHVECGSWSKNLGSGLPIDRFIYDESERIVREYGNHPSFVLFAYGNEPAGPRYREYLRGFVNHWKAKDNRFLTASASGWPEIAENQWQSTPDARIQRTRRGLHSIINGRQPSAAYDWSDSIARRTRPVISHEAGQWCVYPDLKERARYTGVMKAVNFDVFEDRLRESGLLHLAEDFLMASGKLQALCYKADIEAALRTKGFGGFQLLDLHDFPGQGTAPVGILNPFWENKGYIAADRFRRFCNTIVPLARIGKLVLDSGDEFRAEIEIAQYSVADLRNKEIRWVLSDQKGRVADSGSFRADLLPTGTLTRVGTITRTLRTDRPEQYRLTVTIDQYANDWDIWVYPTENTPAGKVLVTKVFDDTCRKHLREGGSVLLSPEFGTLANRGADSCAVGFSTIFWNTLWMNGGPPHTMGILCDPTHPALADFPTQYHSNYQWYDAMSRCNALPLHRLAKGADPIVRIIDDWFSARSLGMIAEFRVGAGKLVISGADLLTDRERRPGARQLCNSLLRYMNSADFAPQQETTPEAVASLFDRPY